MNGEVRLDQKIFVCTHCKIFSHVEMRCPRCHYFAWEARYYVPIATWKDGSQIKEWVSADGGQQFEYIVPFTTEIACLGRAPQSVNGGDTFMIRWEGIKLHAS